MKKLIFTTLLSLVITFPAFSSYSVNHNYHFTEQTKTRKAKKMRKSSVKKTSATARCRDGTLSYSRNRRGTCSHHGGAAQWF